MNVLINNRIAIDKWQTLLSKSPFSSPFQTPEYYKFYNSLDNFSADVFAVEENEFLTVLMIITVQKEKGLKSFFSRRGIIYGGPLINEGKGDSLRYLLNDIINFYKKKLIYLEVRNYFDYSIFTTTLSDSGFNLIPWLNFQLNIRETGQMLARMSSSRARQIKKALKNDVTWKVAEDLGHVNEFYSILKDLYTTKIKKPLTPKHFFTEFFKQNMGKYLLVLYNNKVIGGIMCSIMPNRTIFELYVCGLDKDYKH
ncbi:hypothetical protein ACFLTU_09560, partial [Bacteroidota bacterium]